jgi:hypothetical protein
VPCMHIHPQGNTQGVILHSNHAMHHQGGMARAISCCALLPCECISWLLCSAALCCASLGLHCHSVSRCAFFLQLHGLTHVLRRAVLCRAVLCCALQMGPADVRAALLVPRDPEATGEPVKLQRLALLGDPMSFQRHRKEVCVCGGDTCRGIG